MSPTPAHVRLVADEPPLPGAELLDLDLIVPVNRDGWLDSQREEGTAGSCRIVRRSDGLVRAQGRVRFRPPTDWVLEFGGTWSDLICPTLAQTAFRPGASLAFRDGAGTDHAYHVAMFGPGVV